MIYNEFWFVLDEKDGGDMGQGSNHIKMTDKVIESLINAGALSKAEIRENCLTPVLKPGDVLIVDHRAAEFEEGDLALINDDKSASHRIHRVVKIDGSEITTKGDNHFHLDPPVFSTDIKGKGIVILIAGKEKIFLDEPTWKSAALMIARCSYREALLYREMMREENEGDNDFYKLQKKGEYFIKDDPERSLKYFFRAAACKPSDVKIRVDISRLLTAMGHLDEALIHLQIALENAACGEPASAEIHKMIGDVYYLKGDYQEAIAEYDVALKLCPHLNGAYLARGEAFMKIEKYDKAELDLKKVIKAEENNFKAYKYLGLICSRTRRGDLALEFLCRALKIEENDAEVVYAVGMLEMERGNLEKAKDLFSRAVKINPNHRDACFSLGKIMEATALPSEALVYFSRMLKKFPDDEEIQASINRLAEGELGTKK